MSSDLLTTAEVAKRLGFSEEWVRDHAGDLRAIRAGNHPQAQLRFEPAAIDEWIEARRVAPAPAAPRPRRSRKPQSAHGVELLPRPPASLLNVRG